MTPVDSTLVRRAALTRLAVATRERLPEQKAERDAFFHVYLDGLQHVSTETFTKACRHLELSLSWFPKKHELLEACQLIDRRRSEQIETSRLLTGKPSDPPLTPAEASAWVERLKADVDAKRTGGVAARASGERL